MPRQVLLAGIDQLLALLGGIVDQTKEDIVYDVRHCREAPEVGLKRKS
jgi:hypothetical protein